MNKVKHLTNYFKITAILLGLFFAVLYFFNSSILSNKQVYAQTVSELADTEIFTENKLNSQTDFYNEQPVSHYAGNVLASSELSEEILNDDSGIPDSYLYMALYTQYNLLNPDKPNINKVYYNMFENETALNLSNRSIKSLAGFHRLNMPHLEELNLSKNQLITLNNELSHLISLEKLNLFDNELTSINLSTLYKLNDVNLNRNNLTELNLNTVKSGIVKANFNNITDFNKIKLPNASSVDYLEIELINNNITNFNKDLLLSEKFYFELGLMGAGINYKENATDDEIKEYLISTTTPLVFYNLKNYDITAEIYDLDTNELVLEITNSNTEQYTEYFLPSGEYRVNYINNITGISAYIAYDENFSVFKNIDEFIVRPNNADFKFLINGQYLNQYSGNIPSNAKLVFSSLDEEADIYYLMPGQEWEEGTEVDLKTGGGKYYVFVKCVLDGYESPLTTIEIKTSVNPVLPDLLLLFLILGGAAILFFVIFPLFKKYLF